MSSNFVTVCLVFCLSGIATEAPAAECDVLSQAGPRLDSVIIGADGQKVSVSVPKDYFGGDTYSEKKFQTARSLLLYMHRETLSPYRIKDMRGKIGAGIQDWVDILISNFVNLDRVADISIKIYTTPGRRNETVASYPYRYGLYRYDIPVDDRWNLIDVYYAKDPNGKTDVISCNRPHPENGKTWPQCNQYTRIKGVDVNFSYGRQHLPEWSAMRRNVVKLISCILKTGE